MKTMVEQKKNKKKAFTLVELIIVISILAILATIAFVSLNSYSKSGRDAIRLLDIKTIHSGLKFYNVKSSTYPNPDDFIDIVGVSKQGYTGEGVSRIIKANKLFKDPLNQTLYTYSTSNDNKKMQLSTYLEERGNLNISQIHIFPVAYGNIGTNYTNRIFYTIGDEIGILIDEENKAPIQETYGSGELNITDENNKDTIFKVYFSNTKSETSSGENLLNEIQQIQNSCLLGSTVMLKGETKTAYNTTSVPFLSTCQSIERTCGDSGVLSGDNNYKYDTCSASEALSCTHLGEMISHSGNMVVYSENNIHYTEDYDCQDRRGEVSCYNGSISGDTVYQYKQGQCVKGIPSNCEANSNYQISEKTFQVPQLNHSITANPKPYVDIVENNGTYKYELTITCTDGDLDGIVSPKIFQSCSENYHTEDNGGTCILNTRSCNIVNGTGEQTWNTGTIAWNTCQVLTCGIDYYNPGNNTCSGVGVGYYSPTGGTTRTACSNKPPNSSYTTSGNGGNTCEYSCYEGYEGSLCTAKTKTITSTVYNSRNYPFTSFILTYNISQAQTSQSLNITGGTSILTTTFTLGSDGNNVTLSSSSEAISCNSGYVQVGNECKRNIVTFDGGRRWSDNTYSSSCNLYRRPTGNYTYAGSTGSGIYWIKPDSNPAFKVYCDMSTDGGGWTLVHKTTDNTENMDGTLTQNYGVPNWTDNSEYRLSINYWLGLSTTDVMARNIRIDGLSWNDIQPGKITSISSTGVSFTETDIYRIFNNGTNGGTENTCTSGTPYWNGSCCARCVNYGNSGSYGNPINAPMLRTLYTSYTGSAIEGAGGTQDDLWHRLSKMGVFLR